MGKQPGQISSSMQAAANQVSGNNGIAAMQVNSKAHLDGYREQNSKSAMGSKTS